MANPGAGTCTFSGHRRLSATNAPGRRHMAIPRAHSTKVMSRLRMTLAAGSQPDTRAALQLADRTTFHRREPCTSHSPPARPWGSSTSLLARPARHLFILLISPEQSPPPTHRPGQAPPPHPARCRRPRPAPAADRAFQAKPGRRPAAAGPTTGTAVRAHRLAQG